MPRKMQLDSKLETAQDFVNVEDIDGNILYAKNGYLFGYLQVSDSNSMLYDNEQVVSRAERITNSIATTIGNQPFQILSVPKSFNAMGMIASLIDIKNRTAEDAKLKLLDGEITMLQEMARDGTKEPLICLKLWQKAERGSNKELEKRLLDMEKCLKENNIQANIMDSKAITYLCKQFADLTEYHDAEDEVYEDIPILEGKKRLFTKRREDSSTDENVLRNLITPIGGLSFDVSRIHIGAVIGRVYAAMRYPSELDYSWAVELVNSSDCVTAITYYPGNATTLGNALSSSINRNIVEASSERDARTRKRYERQAADAERLIEQMDYKNSAIGHVSILVMPYSSDAENFEDTCKLVCHRISKKKIKVKPLGSLQKESFQTISPYYPPAQVIEEITKQIMPLESLMGGYPLTRSIFRDPNGEYFAKAQDGSVISLDMRHRGGDRANGNMVITGLAGAGKSTAMKHLLQSLYMTGMKCLLIDPEREYRDLCERLNGSWLDVSGGTAIINPLQIRPIPEDDEAEKNPLYTGSNSAMASHLHTLEVFFSLLFPSLEDVDQSLLRAELILLYNSVHIDFDTDVTALQPKQFPLMEDLYRQVSKHAESNPNLGHLAILLKDPAIGADSIIFNGHTNVDLSKGFIVFDTNRLTNSSETLKRAQYFNLLMLIWEAVSANRSQEVVAFLDEAHTMFEPSVLQTAMYVRNMSKRIRKYEGYLFTVFQSINDLLFREVMLYGQAVLDNSTYKLLFGCSGKNLQDTVELLELTDSEKNILQAQVRGKAVFIAGNQHLQVNFDIPQYKMELMGKAGGR